MLVSSACRGHVIPSMSGTSGRGRRAGCVLARVPSQPVVHVQLHSTGAAGGYGCFSTGMSPLAPNTTAY